MSFIFCPGQANTSMLSIGVRGGGQTYLPTAAVGATGEVKPGIGGAGAIDLRYTYYGAVGAQAELGCAIGAGFGYGAAGIKGTNTDVYSNTDYLGNTIDYTINSDFTQRDRFAKIDLSLLFAMRLNGFTLNVGPRFMLPLAANRSLTINEANIDAYYPAYDVHVVNQLITGKMETPYTENRPSNISKYHLLVAAEIGYEWRMTNQHALGVQLFAEAAVWSKQTPNPLTPNPLIQVNPITDASNPVPVVTIGSVESFVTNRRYLDFGIRAYYAFNIEHVVEHRFKPRGDTRDHRNRYYWW
ncbi:MAG: hypothetical protein IJ249_02485 [Paludibacteraceae bacterium]|nr:hypothetical protein [Paludibacteraceae bacterium]